MSTLQLKNPESLNAAQLIAIHNHVAVKPVKRFSSVHVGVKRTMAAITDAVKSEGGIAVKTMPEALRDLFTVVADKVEAKAEVKAEAKPKAVVKATVKPKTNANGDVLSPLKKQVPAPGPNPTFAGHCIYKLVKSNPRREDTHGWRSFNVIVEGMSFERYKELGGRNNDLRWDVDHGFVRVG